MQEKLELVCLCYVMCMHLYNQERSICVISMNVFLILL